MTDSQGRRPGQRGETPDPITLAEPSKPDPELERRSSHLRAIEVALWTIAGLLCFIIADMASLHVDVAGGDPSKQHAVYNGIGAACFVYAFVVLRRRS